MDMGGFARLWSDVDLFSASLGVSAFVGLLWNGIWWWGGTLRQTYVTQRITTAANSCGKVRKPATTANNPTSSAPIRSPTERISQGASSIPICGIKPASASPQSIVIP